MQKPEKVCHTSLANGIHFVGGMYCIVKPIGSGSFGDIYLGLNTENDSHVAIKVEAAEAECPQLLYEAKVYQHLGPNPGLPVILHHGTEKDYNVIVMELLGPSLEDLFNKCQRHFSLKTVLMLCEQMLARVESVHQRGYIHRDIKPDNFLMGFGRLSSKLYMIDFGLAKRYRNQANQMHIAYRTDRNLTGTVRYASINAQSGVEQSRRDDLESLSYCIMYFNIGRLPWQGISAQSKKQKFEKILEKKNSTPISELCKGWPAEFALILSYSRNLRFQDEPDYVYLRQLFRILFRTLNHQYDFVFDWNLMDKQQEERKKVTRNQQQELLAQAHECCEYIGDAMAGKK